MKNKTFQKVVAGTILIATTIAPALATTFPDVPSDHTFYNYVSNLADAGVIGGYSDGTFRPNENVTRAQMAKFIVNAFDFADNLSCENFPDVDSDNTFYRNITTLKCRNIVGGYSDGTFSPDEPVTRAAATKFIIQAIRSYVAGMNEDLPDDYQQSFSDLSPTHSLFIYVMMAEEAGIVSGYSDGTYKPNNPVTRGAMSKIVDKGSAIVLAPPTIFADARNTQRTADVNTIITAILQYTSEPGNSLPTSITTIPKEICQLDGSCTGYADLSILVPTYLSELPNDPTVNDDNSVGYDIYIVDGDKVKVEAPYAENGVSVSVTR